jgi:peptide/nickel transport system permease protein
MRIALLILSRLLKVVAILLVIITANFLLIHAAPGDPAAVMAGEAGAADEKFLAQLREQFSLDKPLYEQLAIYVGKVMQLDLGYSYRQQMPVAELIFDRLPATLLLTFSAFLISLTAGVAP